VREPDAFRLSRRQLLASSALASLGVVGALEVGSPSPAGAAVGTGGNGVVDFYGTHQAGIVTAAQDHLVFATFDVASRSRSALSTTLDAWSQAAARMASGEQIPGDASPAYPPADTGEALDAGPGRLSVTFGVGPTLFSRPAVSGTAAPVSLADLPAFDGDQLDPTRSGGDVCIQACADDAQVAFHAVHNLARLGQGVLALRALQVGFGRTSSTTTAQETKRNLLGFKDGTDNLLAGDTAEIAQFVWVDDEREPHWMVGGTYLVARRIRARLELWAATPLGGQEAAVGRFKRSGAPLGGRHEHDPVDLSATGAHGLPLIPDGAHIRVASPLANAGQRLLRRGYGFADGVDPVSGELDAGLFFICFQKDPALQFTAIQRRLATNDALHGYLVHTSSGVYACPRGLSPGEGWGQVVLG
jgi:deferrochelatase/peroxidase EfeB